MKPKAKKLAKAGLALSLLAAPMIPLAPFPPTAQAQSQQTNLEKKVERLSYNINCIIKVGSAEFSYTRTGNDYVARVGAQTSGIMGVIFFNKVYSFQTEGVREGGEFLPRHYTYTRKDIYTSEALEVVLYFNFKESTVRSIRSLTTKGQKKILYDLTEKIAHKPRDLLSIIMELRTKPIEPERTFYVIVEGKENSFTIYHNGIFDVKVGSKTYKAHKFKVRDNHGIMGVAGQEAFLYLHTSPNRTPLKLSLKDSSLGNVNIEFAGTENDL